MGQRQVTDDQAGGKHAARLDVFGVGADVADMGIGQRHQLTGIRRIGQDFLIAGHRGVEHDFANGQAGGANRPAPENGTVSKGEDSWSVRHGRLLWVMQIRVADATNGAFVP